MAEKISGGKRLIDKQIPFYESLPSISIITVTYNRIDDLRKTFSSVLSQTYPNIEYIIIDGGSQDGTVDFLRENDKVISFWVSENDAGIYDAMNKGALAATGDWIIFMNSGDKLFFEDTLNQVAAYLDSSFDVVYGGFESILVDRYQTRVVQRKPRNISDIWREIPTCHQSIFLKKDLQIQFPFNTYFNWCADHDVLVRLYAGGYKFKEIPIVVAKFDASDAIERDILTYTKERWQISNRLANRLKRHRYFLREYWKFLIWKNVICPLRNLLPQQWVIAWRKYRGTG